MKRTLCCLISLFMFFSFVGCNSDTPPVLSGIYYVRGDFEEGLTPSLDDNTFSMGAGSLVSFGQMVLLLLRRILWLRQHRLQHLFLT